MQKNKFISSHNEELKKKRKKAYKIKVIVFSILFILILVGLYFLSRWNQININKVEVVGAKVLDKDELEAFVYEKIEGKYLYLFPKSNFVITPRSKIKRELTSNFRRIETLNFDVSNPETLKIEITERAPLYTWCGEVFDTSSPCKFVDKDGYVFDDAPYFSGDIYFRFYGHLVDYRILKDNFKNLVLFINNLKRINLIPVALVEVEDGELEIYLSSNRLSKDAPKIILNSKDDLEKVFQNLNSALLNEPLKSKIVKDYSKLKYLDLRFVNKVYYKFDE
jgi:hypothetical protein